MQMKLNLEDGTYFYDTSGNLIDYAERWGQGYIVGKEKAEYETIPVHRLFGVRANPETGEKDLKYVAHIDSRVDAMNMAKNYGERYIWDLRSQRAVEVV